MTTFLRDILEDMREKRLIPVAVAMALAIVAAPVLLLDRGGDVSSPPPTSPARVAAQDVQPLAKLAALENVRKPDVTKLASKNPFDSPVPELKSIDDAAAASGADGATQVFTGGSTASSRSSAPSTVAGATPPPVGGGSPPPSGPTGDGKAPKKGDKKKPSPRTKVAYTFQVDVTFGETGRTRPLKRMNRFAMLPDSRAPLLVFLGVDASESHALFLVDASLSQSGEGSCGDDACSFVELRLGNERSFTDEHGRTYLLRLDQIRKVTVKKAAPRSSRSEAGERPAARTAGGVARPFLSPLLGDLVE